jgi:hypothetical protein
MSQRFDQRRKGVKKGIDLDEMRKKREDETVSLRKSKREETLMKRRNITLHADQEEEEELPLESFKAFPELLTLLQSGDLIKQLDATSQIRKMLSVADNPPIDAVLASGCVPYLVHFLTLAEHPNVQFEACWALTNIASGESKHTQALVDLGAVSPLIGLLGAPTYELREQAVWALGNIAGDGQRCRDCVLSCGIVPPLVGLIHHAASTAGVPITLLRNATWTMSNLFRGKPAPPLQMVVPALPTVAALAQHATDKDVLVDVLWALSYATDGDDRIQSVIDSGVFPRVIQILTMNDAGLQMPALRAVGNVLTGSHTQTQSMLDIGVMAVLVPLLRSPKKGIRKEACWALSNVAAGTKAQIDVLLGSGALEPVVDQLKSGDFEVRKEAAWVLSNATAGGTPEQVRKIVHHSGTIRALCDLLNVPDNKLVKVVLDAIENILRAGASLAAAAEMQENPFATLIEEEDGLEKIEGLQNHSNQGIYDRAVKILEEYYEAEEDDNNLSDVDAAQGEGQGQGQAFSFAPSTSTNPAGGFQFHF